MELKAASPKHKIHQVVKITVDNIQEISLMMNGTVVDGILTFKFNNTTLMGIPGDWFVAFGEDVHIYTDAYFQRNYESVDGIAEEW